MERVVVIGGSGSGKTTVAAQLGTLLDAPHIELDALNWEPNWVEAPLEVFQKRVTEAVATNRWVIDGSYRKVRDIVWPRATTIVWLDIPLVVSFWRLILRTFKRRRTGELLWGNNRENLKNVLTGRDSLFLYALKTHWRRRREYQVAMSQPEHAHIENVRLSSHKQIRKWLDSVTPINHR